MTRAAAALPLLPPERLAPLAEDYARLRRAERRRVLAGGGVALLLALLTARLESHGAGKIHNQ